MCTEHIVIAGDIITMEILARFKLHFRSEIPASFSVSYMTHGSVPM
jgi:hypothetical protein